MNELRLAVVGFGKLGHACSIAINQDTQSVLAGIVRQRQHVKRQLPPGFENISVVEHISELGQVHAALICVPTDRVIGVAYDLLQNGVPIVECATLHGEEFQAHKIELDRIARLHKVSAIVGAGWDPGALSLFRGLFALLTPKGHTEITHRPGVNLHHTTLTQAIEGIKGALSTELRSASGQRQYYVYVELEEGTRLETVNRAILEDPLFANEEIFVFPVDDIRMLEEQGHGVLLERRGSAGADQHQLFLLEGRFSEQALAAQVMVTAAHTIPARRHGAYSLFDLPIASLWADLQNLNERQWI